jgi:uncharacterized protein DUF1064
MAARPVRLAQTPRSKYRATPTTVDGIRFHSAAEARRYGELKLLWDAGEIVGKLELQPRFPLRVSRTDMQTNMPETLIGEYVADFRYRDRAGNVIVEDVKGMKSLPLYRWKVKHLEAQYGIKVREIRYR